MNQYEREQEQLERDLADGRISNAEYNKQLREMQRSFHEEAVDAAERAYERAYRDVMEGG